jgi:hypothetical protein
MTKEERKIYMKNYYENNKRKYNEYDREYYLKNKERLKKQRNEQAKEYYLNHKEQRKEYVLQKLYNITLEQYNNMLKSQDNKCAVCKNDFEQNDKICIDHNHNTNQVRGLLCHNCNIILGMANDNKEILQNAINYLNINTEI